MWKRGELIVVIAAGKQGVLDNHAAHLALDFKHRLHPNCGAIAIAVDMMCCLKFLLKQ